MHSDATQLTIQGQAADNAATFGSGSGKISLRPRTTAAVTWPVEPWLIEGQSGAAQRSPNLAAVVQEIVNRPGWVSNNSLAMITLLIVIPALLLGTAYLFRRLESRERLLAIEKGVYQPISAEEGYRRARRIAVVLIAAGIGVILAFVLEAFAHRRPPVAAGLGIIPLTIGLGLLFDLRLQRRELRRSASQPLSSADRDPSDR